MKCQAVKKEANQSKTSSFTDNLEGISQNHQDVRHHPIIARLDTMSQMADQFEKYVEEPLQLKEQLNSLLQAVKLMQTEGIQNSDHTDDDEERGQDEDMPSVASSVEEHAQEMKERGSFTSSPDDDHNDEEGYHDELQEQNLMNDARFGLRPQDITETSRRNGRSKSRAESTRRSVPLSTSDYGDEDDNQDNKAIRLSASCKLATTMNRVKQKKSKMNFSNVSEGIDDMQEHPTIGAGAGESMDEYERGLKMMEDAVGPLGDNDDEAADDIDPELGDDENDVGNEFYNQLKKESQQKKQKRKEMYTVAPKYPTLDTEVEGERAIGNMIMKNRGLIPHKNKLNRNPRVKKREQYRKALIRRRGAVREVRTNEAHVYGGEATGIKAGLSRSRKLGVRK